MKAGVLSPDDLVDDVDERRLYSGMRLGRYELVLPVARGGMARVWAARLHGERGFAKPVAVKTILNELTSQPAFERMFLDEASISAAVHHPNVCEVYELGEDDGLLYLAMEWINGGTLASILLKKGRSARPVEAQVAARIVADACAGLHAAHELTDDRGELLHVVHRDVSPHNILVTMDGVSKIGDFGIAKALAGFQNEVTRTGQLKGKIAYMSPEYISGEPIDRRADIFSMGATLYEATTGEQPFRRDNEAAMLLALMEGDLVPPSRLVIGYPAELEQIVLTALSSDRERRFQTAEAMRFALEEFLAKNGGAGAYNRVCDTLRARIGVDVAEQRERLRQVTALLSGRHPSARVSAALGGHFPASPSSAPITPMPIDPSLQVVTISEALLRPRRARLALAACTCLAALAGVMAGVAASTRASTPTANAAAALPPPPPIATATAAPTPKPKEIVVTPADLPTAAKTATVAAPRVVVMPPPRPLRRASDEIPDNPYGAR